MLGDVSFGLGACPEGLWLAVHTVAFSRSILIECFNICPSDSRDLIVLTGNLKLLPSSRVACTGIFGAFVFSPVMVNF